MKILVTGAKGFLGGFVCKKLKQEGHEVIELSSKTTDLTKQGALDVFTDRFDQVYHLAVWTQAGDFCLHHPAEQWVINQQINTNVLAWWADKQPQAKMICMGTSCAYDERLPLEEDYYLEGQPIESLLAYGMTKRMLLTGLINMNKQYGMEYLYVIPSTLFGPEYHTDGRQMHFIFDLIRKILEGKHFDKPVVLWGDGFQKRELVYVEDFVGWLYKLNAKATNGVYNIGAGKERTIREFAQMICDVVGYPFEKIEFDTSRYVGARSKVLNNSKLESVFPGYENGDLEKQIAETSKWFEGALTCVS